MENTLSDISKAAEELLNFLHLAEKLKCTLRHDWTSTGRRESVAEHSWRLALMVMLIAPRLNEPINVESALKMAIAHDIAEAITGDIPYFEAPPGSTAKAVKKDNERRAMAQINQFFKDVGGSELTELWEEYENGKTNEALFVKSLDKLESQLQQLEAGSKTWSEEEISDIHTSRLENLMVNHSIVKELAKTVINKSRTHFINDNPNCSNKTSS